MAFKEELILTFFLFSLFNVRGFVVFNGGQKLHSVDYFNKNAHIGESVAQEADKPNFREWAGHLLVFQDQAPNAQGNDGARLPLDCSSQSRPKNFQSGDSGWMTVRSYWEAAYGPDTLYTPTVERLLGMKPKVDCFDNLMKLSVHGQEAQFGSNFLIDRGSDTPLPLSQLPSECGQRYLRSWRDFVFIIPFDGCYVAQERDSFVLPLLWWGLPVKMSCSSPTSSLSLPTVSCYTNGMIVTLQRRVSEDLMIKVMNEWQPLLKASTRCGYSLVSRPEGVVIHAPYMPCTDPKDGLFTLNMAVEREFNLSCPALPVNAPISGSSLAPANFTSAPANFTSAPANFTSAPANFTSAPANFTSAPANFTPTPSPDTLNTSILTTTTTTTTTTTITTTTSTGTTQTIPTTTTNLTTQKLHLQYVSGETFVPFHPTVLPTVPQNHKTESPTTAITQGQQTPVSTTAAVSGYHWSTNPSLEPILDHTVTRETLLAPINTQVTTIGMTNLTSQTLGLHYLHEQQSLKSTPPPSSVPETTLASLPKPTTIFQNDVNSTLPLFHLHDLVVPPELQEAVLHPPQKSPIDVPGRTKITGRIVKPSVSRGSPWFPYDQGMGYKHHPRSSKEATSGRTAVHNLIGNPIDDVEAPSNPAVKSANAAPPIRSLESFYFSPFQNGPFSEPLGRSLQRRKFAVFRGEKSVSLPEEPVFIPPNGPSFEKMVKNGISSGERVRLANVVHLYNTFKAPSEFRNSDSPRRDLFKPMSVP